MNTRYDNPRLRYSGARGRGFLPASAAGLLGRAVAIAAGGLILVAGLFVSAVVFSMMLVVGLAAGGWLWWKTRHVRRELRERMEEMRGMQPGDHVRGADVIDGDYIRNSDRPAR
jgi:UPF0716 family protein affecting phage T7 exclusion